MKKSTSICVPPFKRASDNKGGFVDSQTKEWSITITICKIVIPILIIVISLSLLAFTYAWFKEVNYIETDPVTISSRYITTIYFENFERDQLDIGNNFRGQTGLGVKGTDTEGDAPYEARFLLSIRVDDNTPVPLDVVLRIKTVTVKKTTESALALTEEQIANNFRVILYNTSTLQEDNTAYSRNSDFILVIRYRGEAENVPFEFSGIDYNGAEFTFAIDMYGEVV